MGRRGSSWRLAAGATMALVVAAVVAAVLVTRHGGASGPSTPAGAPPATPSSATGSGADPTGHSRRADATPAVPPPAAHPSLTLSLGTAGGPAIAPGFLGFSFEFQGVRAYTGSNPGKINPVLVQLIRNVTPGQAPVVRVGGDSTDVSYAPAPGVRPPGFVDYRLDRSWMATTAALAHQLRARMIMGLNLAADQPALARAEARAYVRALGAGTLDALEIGNEPNVYGKITVYRTVFGLPVAARPSGYAYPAYRREFGRIAAASPALGLAAPALAVGPAPGRGSWVGAIPGFLERQRRVSIMTIHRYPLRNCYVPPNSPQYPTIAHLLSGYATQKLAASLERWVAIAHRHHRRLRIDELNSVACRGKAGVSDTFASALWVTDALFALAQAGVDGIDMHTLPNAAYELFAFRHAGTRWQATVRPIYYGLELFARAVPARAQIIALDRHGHAPGLSAWATRARDGTVRVVLINKNRAHNRTIAIRVAAGTRASVQRLLAPSVSAVGGITLAGTSFGASTSTGRLPRPHVEAIPTAAERVKLSVPRGSAALVTVAARPPAP